MKKHFQHLRNGIPPGYNAPILLVTGGPGCGKSYIVDVFDRVSQIMSVGEQIRVAFLGIAAVNINGATMIRLFDIPTFQKKGNQRVRDWNPKRLEEFKSMFDLQKVSAIIIDEISTVQPHMLGYINARLQEATQNYDSPFGGIAVVLLGDFDQLPPVGGTSIPELAMTMLQRNIDNTGHGKMNAPLLLNKKDDEANITSIARRGVEVFLKANHVKLTRQHRSEDRDHTELLNRMSNGEAITPGDFDTYKLLGALDKEFEFATILTPGNRERLEFNWMQSLRWAHQNNTNVVRWHKRIKENTWKGKPKDAEGLRRSWEDRCFWELFVPNAIGYITFNLNVQKGIANGLPVKYESISFLDKDFENGFLDQLRCSDPGEVITIDQPPDFINVEIFPDIPGDDNTTARNVAHRKEWKGGSLSNDGRIVIPISIIQNKRDLKWTTSSIRGGGGFNFRPSRVQLADFFPLEPGFSVTLHKAQVRRFNFFLSLSRTCAKFSMSYFSGKNNSKGYFKPL